MSSKLSQALAISSTENSLRGESTTCTTLWVEEGRGKAAKKLLSFWKAGARDLQEFVEEEENEEDSDKDDGAAENTELDVEEEGVRASQEEMLQAVTVEFDWDWQAGLLGELEL